MLVFGLVMFIARVPIRQFVRAVREPAAIAFATAADDVIAAPGSLQSAGIVALDFNCRAVRPHRRRTFLTSGRGSPIRIRFLRATARERLGVCCWPNRVAEYLLNGLRDKRCRPDLRRVPPALARYRAPPRTIAPRPIRGLAGFTDEGKAALAEHHV